jgi:hypothetical protein
MNADDLFDNFLHLFEQGLDEGTLFKSAQKLFPALSMDGPYYIEDVIKEHQVMAYGFCRSYGMTRRESAHGSEFTYATLVKILSGEGVSLAFLREFIHTEVYTAATTQQRHLAQLDDTETREGSKDFLKFTRPDRYNDKLALAIIEEDNKDVKAIDDKDIEQALKDRGIPIQKDFISDVPEDNL